MTRNSVYALGITMIALVVAIFVVVILTVPKSDGIEEGKEYGLAYTYLSDIKLSDGKVVIAGRTFDFSDRNLPRLSVVVPLTDRRGDLVYENTSIRPGTVKKLRVKVPAQNIEGVSYPGYEYIVWHFNFNVKTKQEIIPKVTPKR